MATSILNVKVATNEYLELSDTINLGYQTIDGVIIRAGDRILVKSQGSGSLQLQNGIYAPNSSGVLQRTTDFALGSTQKSGQLIVVAEGDSFKDTGWVVATDTVNGDVTVGTDLLIFSRFSINGNLVGVDVPSSIILRSEKGYPLTITELDNNFKYLANGLTEKLNIVDFNPTNITDKINSISAAAASLDAWELRGLAPSVEVIENTQSVAVRNTDGSLTSDLFIGNLQGRADTATNADIATIAGNVTGIVAVVNGGTGANTEAQARINLGVVGVDGGNPMSGKLVLAPSTNMRASVNMTAGIAPAAPAEGDIWTSGANLFYRLAGITQTVAPLRSPALVGAPTAPTADISSNSTNLATTAYVWSHVNVLNQAINTKANINSATLTGEPRSTTPDINDNSTRISTTEYVRTILANRLLNYYDKAEIDLKMSTERAALNASIAAVDDKASRALEQAGIPVGSVLYFAANAIPIGYLKCNGSLISRHAYPHLFSAIGYTYGGGGDFFRLPDLRGEFVRGFDDGRGVDNNRLFASFQQDGIGAHYHAIQFIGFDNSSNTTGSTGGGIRYAAGDDPGYMTYNWDSTFGINETRPRNIALMPCIKAFGTIQDPQLLTATQVLVSISDKVDKRGDAMTGYLNLNADPVSALHAATKQYVDSTVANAAVPSKVSKSGDSMSGYLTLNANPTSDLHAATKQYVDARYDEVMQNAGTPVGSIMYYPTATVPFGWLKCNGDLVSTTAYAALFAKIGYTYGGSGNLFRLPDLRGEFIRGVDDGRGIDPGRQVGTWQKGTMVGGYDDNDASSHASVLQSRGSNDYGSDLVTGHIASSQYYLNRIKWSVPQGEVVYPIDYASSWVSITRPRNVALTPCIKAFGTIDDADQINASNVINSINNKVSKTGDTMSGALTLPGAPTADLHAATKKYVDDTSAYIQNNFASNSALSGRVARSGDSMTGYLSVPYPASAGHAATKQYVDNVAADVRNSIARPYTITSGASYTVGYTNYVGSFADWTNYFDVFPPWGKSMGNIVAFIPSIHVIHFNGDVDYNDSIRCTYSYLSDRIRVYVQNTEQRSTPAANWLAIWS